jgi:hypothetical protein
MKRTKILVGVAILGIAGLLTIAADHIDAPAVASGTTDVTDFYAFQAENTNNVVFVANVQGLLSPSATANALFDENVMIEFNIDNDGDAIEDLVIQAVPKNKKMFFIGPFKPGQTGLVSTVEPQNFGVSSNVSITPFGSEAIIESADNGMKFFAGPRDDPFFFDFAQYSAIISGNATSFNDPGSDTFAGTNVMSVVVEVPKAMIGGSGSVNTWVETKRKQ